MLLYDTLNAGRMTVSGIGQNQIVGLKFELRALLIWYRICKYSE
jgi:hypothetical protein